MARINKWFTAAVAECHHAQNSPRTNYQSFSATVTFSCCLSGLFLEIIPGLVRMPQKSPKDEPFGIAGARYLQAGCPSYQPTNSVRALKASLPVTVVNLQFIDYKQQ